MVDKVKSLKLENSSLGGTEVDVFPTETNPAEDYLAAKGVAFENNDNRLVDLDGSGNIQFKDAVETVAITVRKLRTALWNIFDNTSNGFSSTNVQAAIEEAKLTAPGLASRYVATAGFAGNANTNTWLQFFRSNASNSTPFVIAEASTIKSLSLAVSSPATGVVSVFKNGSSVASISLSASDASIVVGLNISFVPTDKMSAKVTSGSLQNPGLYISLQTVGV